MMIKATTLQELFSRQDRWTQRTFAKDVKGDCVDPQAASATCFCLSGGLKRVYGTNMAKYLEVRAKIVDAIPHYGSITSWNDVSCRRFNEIKELVTRLNI